jgi:hypothetical protein
MGYTARTGVARPPHRPDREPVQSLFAYTHAGQGSWFAQRWSYLSSQGQVN